MILGELLHVRITYELCMLGCLSAKMKQSISTVWQFKFQLAGFVESGF